MKSNYEFNMSRPLFCAAYTLLLMVYTGQSKVRAQSDTFSPWMVSMMVGGSEMTPDGASLSAFGLEATLEVDHVIVSVFHMWHSDLQILIPSSKVKQIGFLAGRAWNVNKFKFLGQCGLSHTSGQVRGERYVSGYVECPPASLVSPCPDGYPNYSYRMEEISSLAIATNIGAKYALGRRVGLSVSIRNDLYSGGLLSSLMFGLDVGRLLDRNNRARAIE